MTDEQVFGQNLANLYNAQWRNQTCANRGEGNRNERFCEILASTYGPEPLIILKNILSQIYSRTISKKHTAPGANQTCSWSSVHFKYGQRSNIWGGHVNSHVNHSFK